MLTTFSEFIGLTLLGIELDPTCLSKSKYSETSSISGLCRFLISVPIFSSVTDIPFRTDKYSDASMTLSRCLPISERYTDIFSPSVIGDACCPCVLPIIGRSLYFSIIEIIVCIISDISCSRMLLNAFICTDVAVSSTSFDVNPKWTNLPPTGHCSEIAFTIAMTS